MPSANRTAKITARYRQRERELIEEAAGELGVHLAEFIRETTVAAARRYLRGPGRNLPSEVSPREIVG